MYRNRDRGLFFCSDTVTTAHSPLSLHDALPICAPMRPGASTLAHIAGAPIVPSVIVGSDRLYSKKSWLSLRRPPRARDRKSTRLNSSHVSISYAVFCLKKKK